MSIRAKQASQDKKEEDSFKEDEELKWYDILVGISILVLLPLKFYKCLTLYLL